MRQNSSVAERILIVSHPSSPKAYLYNRVSQYAIRHINCESPGTWGMYECMMSCSSGRDIQAALYIHLGEPHLHWEDQGVQAVSSS
jgi:hypothetical protein